MHPASARPPGRSTASGTATAGRSGSATRSSAKPASTPRAAAARVTPRDAVWQVTQSTLCTFWSEGLLTARAVRTVARSVGSSAAARRPWLSRSETSFADGTGLTVPAVVMDGFRRVDEWRGLESAVGDFEGVLGQDAFAIAAIPADKLTAKERTVLDAVDGQRTLREVIAASHMSSFDACRILAELLSARVVRRIAG